MTVQLSDIRRYVFLWCDISLHGLDRPFGNAEITGLVSELEVVVGKALELREKVWELRKACQHNWVLAQGGYHAICSECGLKQDGWWCPTSPDKQCHYPGEDEDVDTATDDNVNYDSCIHCGLPSERK